MVSLSQRIRCVIRRLQKQGKSASETRNVQKTQNLLVHTKKKEKIKMKYKHTINDLTEKLQTLESLLKKFSEVENFCSSKYKFGLPPQLMLRLTESILASELETCCQLLPIKSKKDTTAAQEEVNNIYLRITDNLLTRVEFHAKDLEWDWDILKFENLLDQLDALGRLIFEEKTDHNIVSIVFRIQLNRNFLQERKDQLANL